MTDPRRADTQSSLISPVKRSQNLTQQQNYQSGESVQSGAETQQMKATAPQLEKLAGELRQRVESGALAEGNLELAAILGFQAAQIALGRKVSQGFSTGQLIQFLLEDPNLKIQISVG